MAFIYTNIIIILILTLLYLLSYLFSTQSDTFLNLLSPYECGLEPIGSTRIKFEIIYYIIALLYLIFDLEILFLFPLATILTSLNHFLAYSSAILFFLILTLGFIYEWSSNILKFVRTLLFSTKYSMGLTCLLTYLLNFSLY